MAARREIVDIKEYRARRKRAGSMRWVLILILLITCLFAGYFFARSDFFTIRAFEVTGNSQVAEERIVELSGIHPGENIFTIDSGNVEQWLTIEPKIKSAKVSKRLPGTVVISVVERQAAALINVGGAMIEIDDAGRVLARYTLISGASLPLISGVDLSNSGSIPGCTVEGEGITAALNILRSLPADAEGIGELNVANPQYIRLYTVRGTEIRLGNSDNFADKYLVYSNILKDNKEHGGAVLEYIDVSTRVPAISTQN